jgi:hypothetical protein
MQLYISSRSTLVLHDLLLRFSFKGTAVCAVAPLSGDPRAKLNRPADRGAEVEIYLSKEHFQPPTPSHYLLIAYNRQQFPKIILY